MKKNTIITIGREFGSGGHEIGNRLSERLDIPLYDRNLIQMAANELGISSETAEAVDETILGKFLSAYVVSMGDYTTFATGEEQTEALSDQVYRVQGEIIRKLAERGSCIIVGRCADYILEEEYCCINAFICANTEDKIKRVMKIYNLTEKQAKEKIKKKDKERKLYYEAHTGQPWGDIASHQMLFNVSRICIGDIVDILVAMYRARR